jgi:peptidoglycan hydrolase-like protein with peptidoglycan-binding domain
VEPTRLLVLHEVAEEAWRQQHASVAADDNEEDVERQASDAYPDTEASRSQGVRKPVALVAVVAAALLGMGAGTLITAPGNDGDDGSGKKVTAAVDTSTRPTSSSPTPDNGLGPYIFKPGKTYPCKVSRTDAVDGGLGAGYSKTSTAVLAGPGWDVVEAQCLLDHHKMEPGTVDGIYGQQTIAAVMRLQKDAGLPADGIVGPHTWRVLRE